MSVPNIFQPVIDTTHRVLKVPGFEVDLRLGNALLDPKATDRVAITVEVEIVNGKPDYALRVVDGGGSRLDRIRLLYDGRVVPGSVGLSGYEAAPEQLQIGAEV